MPLLEFWRTSARCRVIISARFGGRPFFCYKWGMEGSVEWFFGPQLVPRDLSKGVTDVRSSPAIRRHQR